MIDQQHQGHKLPLHMKCHKLPLHMKCHHEVFYFEGTLPEY